MADSPNPFRPPANSERTYDGTPRYLGVVLRLLFAGGFTVVMLAIVLRGAGRRRRAD